MIRRLEHPGDAAELFKGWDETAILSATQGVMGEVYVPENGTLDSAAVILGDFCFLGGRPETELVRSRPMDRQKDFIIMVPGSEAWSALIESVYGDRALRVTRYAIRKEGDVFDRKKLDAAARELPEGCALRFIDREIYETSRKSEAFFLEEAVLAAVRLRVFLTGITSSAGYCAISSSVKG